MATVTLINSFEVPQEEILEAVAFWEKIAVYMKKQPGFISTKLHKAVVPWARFQLVNIAQWESAEHFEAVANSEEFKQMVEPYMEVFPHYPGLYEVIRR